MPVLRAGPAEAVVDPVGGRLTSLLVAGRELLVTRAPTPIGRGLFPMVPFAGRIRHGRFSFAGTEYQLPCNLPPHAIHGTVLETAWTTEIEEGAAWSGRVELAPPWPFGGTAAHHVTLGTGGLSVRLEVANDRRAMPVTAGWHPWWRRRLERSGPELVLDVELDGARMYQRGADHLPTGAVADPGPPPWDDCFTGLARPPRLRWPGALTVTCETSADHWVLFTEPPPAVCVEPQTGPPDAVNLGFGYQVVEPGRPLVVEAAWTWGPDPAQA